MAQLTYPGVYIEEVPSGVRAISAVSSSIAAFVDRFRKGEKNKAIPVFGMADVERIFGGISADSPASYGLSQFFLNGGSQAYVVRVETATADEAGMSISNDAATPTTVLAITARSEGTWANQIIRVRIDPPAGTGADLEVTVTQYASTDANALPVIEERYRASTSTALAALIDEQSALVRATAPAAGVPAANGLVWTPPGTVPASLRAMTVTIHTPGVAPSAAIPVTYPTGTTATTMEQVRIAFESALRAAGRAVGEPALAGASVLAIAGGRWRLLAGRSSYHPGMRFAFSGLGAEDLALAGSGTTAGLTSAQNNPQEYVLGAPAGWTFPLGAHRTSTPGIDGGALTPLELIGDRASKTGMYALLDVDLFNLLCLPAAAQLGGGDSTIASVYSEAERFCAERRAFLLVDPPPDVDTFAEMDALPARFSLLRSPNAAWYVPHVQVADPTNDFQPRTVAPSGTIAGIFARTDAERGPWVAPAGVDAILRGVLALDVRLSDQENGVLNRKAVNCLRTFPVQGRIVWGARTLEGDDALASEWRYIPIRRLALMIEESLFRGTKWAVFQPNDEPLWARLRQNVGAFMHRLFRQGAFQGATPREAYFVRCDRQTNPPEDRELGIVTVEVGFAPLKPAEFVVIRIQQIAELTA